MFNRDRKIAVIGLGNWGKKLLQKLQQFGITYVFTPNKEETVGWLSNNFRNAIYVNSIEAILENKEISHIFIATPIQSHEIIVKKALNWNKKIWIEKPMAPSSTAVESLIKIAKKTGAVLYCDHIYANLPIITSIKTKAISTNPKEAVFTWHKYGTFKENIIWNLAYHDIYIALKMFGEPKRVSINQRQEQLENKASFIFSYDSFDAIFLIDRESKNQEKMIKVRFDDENIVWTKEQVGADNTDLLMDSLQHFFSLRNEDPRLGSHYDEVYMTTKFAEEVYNQFLISNTISR